jgi:nicotinamide mononucleotide adenylyltransferase
MFKKALTFGRFSPIKKGHVCGIIDMLRYCEFLVVGVVDSLTEKVSVSEKFANFCQMADLKNHSNHTRFSLEQRLAMAQAALSRLIKENRVDVIDIPRPEYAIDKISERFPADQYQIFFSNICDTEFDRERNVIMPEMLNRSIFLVQPSDIVIHNTQLVEDVNMGNLKWADIIPEESLGLFLKYKPA